MEITAAVTPPPPPPPFPRQAGHDDVGGGGEALPPTDGSVAGPPSPSSAARARSWADALAQAALAVAGPSSAPAAGPPPRVRLPRAAAPAPGAFAAAFSAEAGFVAHNGPGGTREGWSAARADRGLLPPEQLEMRMHVRHPGLGIGLFTGAAPTARGQLMCSFGGEPSLRAVFGASRSGSDSHALRIPSDGDKLAIDGAGFLRHGAVVPAPPVPVPTKDKEVGSGEVYSRRLYCVDPAVYTPTVAGLGAFVNSSFDHPSGVPANCHIEYYAEFRGLFLPEGVKRGAKTGAYVVASVDLPPHTELLRAYSVVHPLRMRRDGPIFD